MRGGTLESLATDSWGVLEFRDGSTVTISGQAVLTISEDEQKELYLGLGRLSATVTPQPDGNTPLHVAAFLCHTEIVHLLLESGGSASQKNNRGEAPIDVVSGEWSEGLAGFYNAIGDAVGIRVDLERIEQKRPEIARLLRDHAALKKQEAASEGE